MNRTVTPWTHENVTQALEERRISGKKWFMKWFWKTYRCPHNKENSRAVLASFEKQ